MDIFRGLGSRSLSVTAMLKNVDFLGKTNTAIHGLTGHVTVLLNQKTPESLHQWWVNAGRLPAKSAHHQASIAQRRVFAGIWQSGNFQMD